MKRTIATALICVTVFTPHISVAEAQSSSSITQGSTQDTYDRSQKIAIALFVMGSLTTLFSYAHQHRLGLLEVNLNAILNR